MFKIDDDGRTIIIHRGDAGTILYSIDISDTEKYQFQIGDKIRFIIYEKKGYNKVALLNKEFIVTNEAEEIELSFTTQDMNIEELDNRPITCWYEILLNNEQTINGYDKDEGAAKIIILPSKKE